MYIEFCGGGAVDSIMQELEKPLTEPQIRCICHEMCEALDFLHQNFVIHRDLKAGNVLLTADGQVRLGQFTPTDLAFSIAVSSSIYITWSECCLCVWMLTRVAQIVTAGHRDL